MTQPRGALERRVAVVVVNFRTWHSTADAVRSVLDEPDVAEIIVVDNASGDESVQKLQETFRQSDPPAVRVIENEVNDGYGQGCQIGADLVRSPVVLFLNSDARMSPGSLRLLLRVLEADPTIGVVSPVIVEESTGRPEPKTAGRFPTVGSLIIPASFRSGPTSDGTTDWVAGTAMMLRKTDFSAAGGFDPRFVMYMEDVDLCRRLTMIGHLAVRVANATAVHSRGASWSSEIAKARAGSASQLIYFRKEGTGRAGLAVVRAVAMARLGRSALHDALGRLDSGRISGPSGHRTSRI